MGISTPTVNWTCDKHSSLISRNWPDETPVDYHRLLNQTSVNRLFHMRIKMVPSSLSRLTDDEAKHVWQVIQRDFNLRKKEEDRLGELKTKLKKEDTKRELLVFQPKLSDSLCIRCLQPFKFLVNSKRQCLDCKLFVCKSCSQFNKTEHGWVCDPCHMARILKIGTLEWFHENVRSRFKRFGSAKVMNLLIKRLDGDRACSQTDLREHRDDDTHSMPEVHNGSLYSQADEESECADRRHSLTRKARRLLPVHPLDFNLVIEKFDYSQPDFFLYAGSQEKIAKNRCSVTEENCSKTFKQNVENETHGSSTRSLSKMSFSSAGSTNYHLHHELYNSLDDSEDEDLQMQVIYSPALQKEPSPEIIELEKRMSAIENLLVHLEQKMFSVTEGTVEEAETKEEDVADLEELELRKKLDELTDKISDKGLSSDEDDVVKSEAVYSSAVTRGALAGPLEIKEWKAQPNVHKSLKNQRRLSPFDLSNTTSCELSQLEGKVAMAAASVQSTQCGVTDIQKRLAALGAAGVTVETSRRRASLQLSNVLCEFPIRASNEIRSFRKLSIM